ncbi:MAG: methionyl-tRNA formyltransferase [Actinomycetota bacterium]
MRVVFLGNDPWSVPSVEALASSSHDLALVVTRVPKPAGRKGELRPTAVAQAARSLELPLLETATVKRDQGFEAIRSHAPDILAVVAYGEILPEDVLELPAVAPVNVHFSLLPALRGADPVRRAILEGLTETGVTTIRMDQGMDTGPILLHASEPIRDTDDSGALGERLAAVGGELLVRTLDGLESGELQEEVQDHDLATMAPKLKPEDEWIDWTGAAELVWRQVRALAPDPGAKTRLRERVVKVVRAEVVEGSGEPGTVIEVSNDRLAVAAAEGALSLQEVIPEGRKRMSGVDFARGQRPSVGERLG